MHIKIKMKNKILVFAVCSVTILINYVSGRTMVRGKMQLCASVVCGGDDAGPVCGWRVEGDGVRLRAFKSECDLINYGCAVHNQDAYGIVDIELCDEAFSAESSSGVSQSPEPNEISYNADINSNSPGDIDPFCTNIDCSYSADNDEVCGIRNEGEGFVIRLFQNKCELYKYNCKNAIKFDVTDRYICSQVNSTEKQTEDRRIDNNSISSDDKDEINDDFPVTYTNETFHTESRHKLPSHTVFKSDNIFEVTKDTPSVLSNLIKSTKEKSDNLPRDQTIEPGDGEIFSENEYKEKNLIIIPPGTLNPYNDHKDEIKKFFQRTHSVGIPLKEMNNDTIISGTRRKIIKILKPLMLYEPWIKIPKNISDDPEHMPTLLSCYHKCPKKCPDTYSPVCGVPGILSRDPSIMFQNHCYMDVAQCKIYAEKRGPSASSNSYIESSFLICLGDELNNVYRFLPLLKTLQKMGRLKSKSSYKYKVRNLRFFNELLPKNIQLMG